MDKENEYSNIKKRRVYYKGILFRRFKVVSDVKLTKEEILDIIDPLKFIGRAPSQVVEFIDEYVTPIINENKDALEIKSEINV